MVHKLSLVERHTNFSWFNKNNSSTIKDMKNLSTRMNYTGLIIPQTKFQPRPMKDEENIHFSEFVYSIVKYETLVPNISSIIVLKH